MNKRVDHGPARPAADCDCPDISGSVREIDTANLQNRLRSLRQDLDAIPDSTIGADMPFQSDRKSAQPDSGSLESLFLAAKRAGVRITIEPI